MKRFLLKLLKFILVVGILGGAIAVVVTQFCDLETIEVEGNTLYTDSQIIPQIIDGDYPDNTAYEVLWNFIYPKTEIEFVDKVTVVPDSLNSITLNITEKTWVGYIEMVDGTYVYFDSDGYEVFGSEWCIVSGVVMTGCELVEGTVGQVSSLRSSELKLIVQLLKGLAKYELDIISISFDARGYATVDCGDIDICVGTVDNFEDKIQRLAYILPQIEGQSGLLHLETWTSDSTDIVFEKDE